jgi:thiol:disulfide interchange protein DsbD
VKWTVSLNDLPSTDKEIVLKATVDRGWHLYDQNLPEGGPVSTSIRFETVKGGILVGKPTPIENPMKVFDKHFDMELRWFSDAVTFVQKIKVTDPKRFIIKGEVEFMACNDETCIPPDRILFSFDNKDVKNIPAADTVSDSEEDENTENLPETVEATADDTTVVASPDNKPLKPALSGVKIKSYSADKEIVAPIDAASLWTPVIDELKALGDTTTTATSRSYIYIFIAGFLGGLLALLTPCVWPMIPMTVSFFLKRTKSRRKAITDALLYGFSIIVIYLALGLIITALFGASALNDLSTNAIFNIIFFLLLILFAISFFGAFEIVLPSSWTNKIDSKADATTGLLSIFFMAFTLALVSFSCTGPIIGTLLVEAATSGNTVGPAVGMFGFALALAIPFAMFAIFPNMMQTMPKSGGWLSTVKVVLGFLELALALKFLSVADLAYGWRILDREVFLSLWIVLFALLGLYLLGMFRFRRDYKVKYINVTRLFLSTISLSFAVYMVPGLWGAPLKAISAFAPPLYTQDFNLYDGEVHAQTDDYEEGMAMAAKKGKPVMIDFSGYGCVNCRKMEAAVWTDARVKNIIDNDYVLITLMVDDKTPLPAPIEVNDNGKHRTLRTVGDRWSYLQRNKFGSNAQPYYVLLDNQGYPLAPSYAYNEDIQKYINFLKQGKKNYNDK